SPQSTGIWKRFCSSFATRVVDRFRQCLHSFPEFGIHSFGPAQRDLLRKIVRGRIFGDVWIFPREVARDIASSTFTFLDVLTRPEWLEVIRVRQKVELFALD